MLKSTRAIASVMVAVFAFTGFGCRKAGKSLALPKFPILTAAPAPYVYSLADYTQDLTTYSLNTTGSGAHDPGLARTARNSIGWGLMATIDNVYNEYSANLFSGKGAIGIGGDLTSAGLTAAVAIARQVATKTIFGSLATAVTAGNLSIDKNLFAQNTYQVIALAMETRRTNLYNEISNGLSTKSVADYPLTAVKRDLILYLYAGSLPGGLQEVQKEAGAASANADSKTKPAGAPAQLKITQSTTGTGAGTVTLNPAGPMFATGTSVMLTAVPDGASKFAGWSGDCPAGTGTCTLTMDSNKVVTATFSH